MSCIRCKIQVLIENLSGSASGFTMLVFTILLAWVQVGNQDFISKFQNLLENYSLPSSKMAIVIFGSLGTFLTVVALNNSFLVFLHLFVPITIFSFIFYYLFFQFNNRLSNKETYSKSNFLKEKESILKQKCSIDPNRKQEIFNVLKEHYPKFLSSRKKHLKTLKDKQIDYCKPAWFAVAPTKSVLNSRLILGFQNNGCSYRGKDGIGCYFCGFYASVAFKKKPTNDELFEQFNKVLDKVHTNEFDVLEFGNDGSFLCDKEFQASFRKSIYARISAELNIKRLLIESRLEFITEEKIAKIIEYFRQDQKLEIGIGLESRNDFVREVCLNKGIKINKFENKIKTLSKF